MSSLVDIWTAELAKLREKTRAAFSSPTAVAGELNEFSLASEPEELSLGYPAVSREVWTKPWSLPLMLRTEAAVSMIVDCFSP